MEDTLDILVIGDPHFRAKYIKVVDEFIQQTLTAIEVKKPDIVVILGDTLHDHEQTRESCHSRAVQWFKDIAKLAHLIVLIGNHDRPNNGHFLTTNHFFNGMKGHENIVIVDKAHSVDVTKNSHPYRFVCMPYVPPGRFQEALDTLKTPIDTEGKIPTAIFCHQEIKGCKMGAIASEHGDVWPLDNPYLICGHIHEYQSPQENVLYVGTPYQTTYAEDTNKGLYIFSFTPKGRTVKRIKLNLRVKQTITLAPGDLKTFKIPEDNMDLRILIYGLQAEVEACKQLPIFKELYALPHIKIVLRPILDIKSISGPKVPQVPYLKSLYNEIAQDTALKATYVEILGDSQ